MKFPKVEIANFLAIGSAELELADQGLVHVSGVNDTETSADSNGSGKSSLGDALSWCLWGTTARGLSGDEVVNTKAGGSCRVSTYVEDDDVRYRIDRYRKYPKHKNAVHLFRLNDDGTETDLTKGTSQLTQALIERIVGCSETVYNAAVYSGQEQMPDIPSMTDKQLKILVEEAAGIDLLTNTYEFARSKLRDAQGELSTAQINLDRLMAERDNNASHAERARLAANEWNSEQKDRVRVAAERAKNAALIAKKEVNSFDKDEVAATLQAIKDIEQKISSVKDEVDRERVLVGDLTNAQALWAAHDNKITRAESTAASEHKMLAALQRRRVDIANGVGKPCDECGKPYEAKDIQPALKAADSKIESQITAAADADAEVLKLRAKAPAIEKLVKQADKALTDHRASMTNVSLEQQQLNNLRRELQILQARKSEIERMIHEARQLAEHAKEIAAATNPHITILEELDATIAKNDKKIDMATATLREKKEANNYAEAVVDVFAPAGVRAHRLEEVTPYLNERTAHYLGSLSDGVIDAYWTTLSETKTKGELREKFAIYVEKNGSAPNFKALSGGEKRKVRLACSLALQDLVSTRASKSIELFIGDEIDDALDASGLERLMGILEEKARERGTVLVVSHNDIGAYARRSITMLKKNDVAELSIN